VVRARVVALEAREVDDEHLERQVEQGDDGRGPEGDARGVDDPVRIVGGRELLYSSRPLEGEEREHARGEADDDGGEDERAQTAYAHLLGAHLQVLPVHVRGLGRGLHLQCIPLEARQRLKAREAEVKPHGLHHVPPRVRAEAAEALAAPRLEVEDDEDGASADQGLRLHAAHGVLEVLHVTLHLSDARPIVLLASREALAHGRLLLRALHVLLLPLRQQGYVGGALVTHCDVRHLAELGEEGLEVCELLLR